MQALYREYSLGVQVKCCNDAINLQSTTTLNGQCTDDFTGTSSSSPLVSATIALVLQAKYVFSVTRLCTEMINSPVYMTILTHFRSRTWI